MDAVLREAGKTLDDLRVAVEKLQRRRELKAKLDSMPKLVAQRRDVERKMADANRILEQAEQRHLEETAPLEARIQDLKEQIWAAECARTELWNSCDDEALIARLNEALAAAVRANRQAGALRDEINRHRNQAEANRERADRLVSDSRSEDLRKRADEHDGEVVRPQAQLKLVEREIATLQKPSRLLRTGKARVDPETASIFARLHIDAERWQSTLQSLLGRSKLVGEYFGRLQNLREIAARRGQCWVKNRGTRAAVLAV